MGVTHCLNMKVFIALAALVAVSSGAPRYLVIPIEDVDFGNSNLRLPVYRMPGLARQARAAQEDQYQEPNYDAASNAYLPLLPLAPTMLTMELTLVDMELLAGTMTTQFCWVLDTKQPIIEKFLKKKICQNLPTQRLLATE